MVSESIRQLSPQLYVTDNVGGITVYLDQRLLVQIRDGTVTAGQTYSLAQARLVNKILEVAGVTDYIAFKEGVIYVKTDNQ